MVEETAEYHGAWGSLAVARASFDVRPVIEESGRISVVAGDPVLHDGASSALLDDGGRRVLHAALGASDLRGVAARLDGHFAVLSIDTGGGHGELVTDRFCFVGVFHASHREGGDALVVGTHADAVARASGRGGDLDLVSAADFALHLTCTFPHTLYREVFQALPGATRAFAGRGWTGEPRVYWEPAEEPAFTSLASAAGALRAAMCADTHAAGRHALEVGLLLSGGEDSRALLGAMPPDKRVRAVTFAEWESREVRIARRAARAHGAELVMGRRAADHYLDGFETVASAVGSGHLFTDVHGFGIHDALGLRSLPVVFGGLSADSLLKSAYGARRSREAPDDSVIRADLRRAVAGRRGAFRDLLARARPDTADEWTVLWPFSMRKHGGNVDGNRRLFRSHEVYHATGVLDVAARTPRKWKVHRRLFRLAARPLLRRVWYLPHTEYRFPYFGRGANVVLFPALALGRGVRAVVKGELRSRHRPWPKWSTMAGSDAMARAEQAHPFATSPVGELFEPAPAGQLVRSVREWSALRRFMLLQLSFVSSKARS